MLSLANTLDVVVLITPADARDTRDHFADLIHPAFVFDPSTDGFARAEKLIETQRTVLETAGRVVTPRIGVVVDGFECDRETFKQQWFQQLLINGRRNKLFFMFVTQDVTRIPVALCRRFDAVVTFGYVSSISREDIRTRALDGCIAVEDFNGAMAALGPYEALLVSHRVRRAGQRFTCILAAAPDVKVARPLRKLCSEWAWHTAVTAGEGEDVLTACQTRWIPRHDTGVASTATAAAASEAVAPACSVLEGGIAVLRSWFGCGPSMD